MRISDWSSDVCSSDLHIDKSVRIVTMHRIDGARRVVNGNDERFLTGEVCERLRNDRRYLRVVRAVLRIRRAGGEQEESRGISEKFHVISPCIWTTRSRSLGMVELR